MPPTADSLHPGDGVAALPSTEIDAASELRALATPSRLAIVEMLTRHRELHVHQIVDAVGVPKHSSPSTCGCCGTHGSCYGSKPAATPSTN